MAYGALGDIVDLGDGRYQITTTNRNALAPMATAQDYVNFARGEGKNFFEFNPNESFMFAPQDDLPEKPEGMDLDPPSEGMTPEQLAAGAGATVGQVAGQIGAAAAASGGLSGANLLAGVPFASTLSGTQKQIIDNTKLGKQPVYLLNDQDTYEQYRMVDGVKTPNLKKMEEPSAFQKAGQNLSNARNKIRLGGFDPTKVDENRFLGTNPNIFQDFRAKDGNMGYGGRVVDRLNPLGDAGSAGRINYTTSMYAGGANALTQMAFGVKPKQAIKSAAKTEAVRLGVSALTGSQTIGNIAAMVAPKVIKAAEKVGRKFKKLFGIG